MIPLPARRQVLCALLLALTGCSTTGFRHPGPAHRLAGLLLERLEWMDEVAAVKQERGLPIVDAKREAELLRAMEAQAVQAGLPATSARCFFTGQMEAAKECQRLSLLPGSPLRFRGHKLPDLQNGLRPELDRIGREMIATLVEARRQGIPASKAAPAARRLLAAHRFPESVIQPALQGLAAGLE